MKKFIYWFKNILKKISGLSTPIGGIQWRYSVSDHDIGRRIYYFLRDRRVLCASSEEEFVEAVIFSVREIRNWLRGIIDTCAERSKILEPILELQNCCRAFLSELEPKIIRKSFPVKVWLMLYTNLLPEGIEKEVWIYFNGLRNLRYCFAKNLTSLSKLTDFEMNDLINPILESIDSIPSFRLISEELPIKKEELIKILREKGVLWTASQRKSHKGESEIALKKLIKTISEQLKENKGRRLRSYKDKSLDKLSQNKINVRTDKDREED